MIYAQEINSKWLCINKLYYRDLICNAVIRKTLKVFKIYRSLTRNLTLGKGYISQTLLSFLHVENIYGNFVQ